jgi:hypothetical protein
MAKMLILVHGMGQNDAGWSAAPGGPQEKLNEVAKKYSLFNGGNFTDELPVREISYTRCFQDEINRWNQASAELAQWTEDNSRPLPKVVAWLDKPLPANEAVAKDFFWSTAIQPLLYRGFELFRTRVRVAVMTALVEHLKEFADESLNVTIVAHSLGTMVMHDVLDMVGNGVLPADVKDVEVLTADYWKLSSIFMIADVCRLGPSWIKDIDYYSSVVRPVMPDGSVKGISDKFFEVWHRFDPFAIAAPFRPKDWGPGYQPVDPLSHFRQANVHGYTHYLDHPKVHVPIINYALRANAITADKAADARAKYADIVSPECDQQIERIKAKAMELAAVGDDIEQVLIKVAEFYALARDASQKCRGIA